MQLCTRELNAAIKAVIIDNIVFGYRTYLKCVNSKKALQRIEAEHGCVNAGLEFIRIPEVDKIRSFLCCHIQPYEEGV